MLDAAALGVQRAEIEPPDPREGDGGRAHGAGLEGDMQIAADETLVADGGAGRSDRQDFRVGRGVGEFARAVSRRGEEFSVAHDHRADGNLSPRRRRPRLLQRPSHGRGLIVPVHPRHRFVVMALASPRTLCYQARMTNTRDDDNGRRPPRSTSGRAGGGARPPRAGAPSGKPYGKAPPRAGKAGGKPYGKPPARSEEPKRVVHEEPQEERIAKAMARAGVASRRDAEVMIEEGRVRLNGVVLTSPAQNVTAADRIEVDGEPLPARERTRLWLFHKPRGLVTTARDPEGRPTVFDNLPEDLPRVVAIGRLDINTEGLLLLTNDGGLAKVIAHPDTGWLRRYRVRAYGDIDQARLDTLRDGIVVDGMEYGPIEAKLDRVQGDNAWLLLGLREGKNREVKRILEHLGLRVNRLIRLSFGPFQLGELPEGAVEEVRTRVLKDQLGDTLAQEAGVDFESPVREPVAPFGPPPEPERAPRRDDRGRPARGRGDAPAGGRGEGRAEAPPRRPAWDRQPRASIWRADEALEERKFKPRRKTDPKEDRSATAERARERVGAINAKGGRVLVERLKSAPAEAAPERPERPERRPRPPATPFKEARPAREARSGAGGGRPLRDDRRPRDEAARPQREERGPRGADRAGSRPGGRGGDRPGANPDSRPGSKSFGKFPRAGERAGGRTGEDGPRAQRSGPPRGGADRAEREGGFKSGGFKGGGARTGGFKGDPGRGGPPGGAGRSAPGRGGKPGGGKPGGSKPGGGRPGSGKPGGRPGGNPGGRGRS